MFVDKKSGKDLNREEYFKMKEFVRKNDVAVFAELDCLGRTKEDVDKEWSDLIQKGVDIVILIFYKLFTCVLEGDNQFI
ncbi:hypothetical protein GLW04_19330 [Halobacillus litoralis]|uniref:Resolvase/invertase-type recombinase catalytic domain-containing protein n=1 Tax=Halobacillus litoralis TaxID=45668 RepID=A0A845DWV5_9BACI|nr:hypothetical protein [Halobacillus litoralis]